MLKAVAMTTKTIAASQAIAARASDLGYYCTGVDVVLLNIFAGDLYGILKNILHSVDEEEHKRTVENLVKAHDLLEPSLRDACRVQYLCNGISKASLDAIELRSKILREQTRLFYIEQHNAIDAYVQLVRSTLQDLETCFWYLDDSMDDLGKDFERVMGKIKGVL